MSKFLGIIVIGLALVAVACGGGGNEFPKQGVIDPDDTSAGVGLYSEVEDNGRICVRPPENFLQNADGSRLMISPGTRVEILEEATCVNDRHQPYKAAKNGIFVK